MVRPRPRAPPVAPPTAGVATFAHGRRCDGVPDGRAILLGDAARRISLRASFASRQPVAASTAVTVEFADLAAGIGVGHRLLLAVAGSNAPRLEVSPVAARITVHFGGPEGSRVLLRAPRHPPVTPATLIDRIGRRVP